MLATVNGVQLSLLHHYIYYINIILIFTVVGYYIVFEAKITKRQRRDKPSRHRCLVFCCQIVVCSYWVAAVWISVNLAVQTLKKCLFGHFPLGVSGRKGLQIFFFFVFFRRPWKVWKIHAYFIVQVHGPEMQEWCNANALHVTKCYPSVSTPGRVLDRPSLNGERYRA